jgi:hypothetical protein
MPAERPKLDAKLLTPADLRRARDALDGKNPWELLNDPIDAITLTIYCLRSRSDKTFTWEQAENTPMGEFDMGGGEPPPTTAGPESNGTKPGSESNDGSKRKRPSATSTGSTSPPMRR